MSNSGANKSTEIVDPFRILSLDGGGAKGFYTLGILSEIEAMTGRPIAETFDLIYGTSTGAIIAALLARGETVATVLSLYTTHVPTLMKAFGTCRRTNALHKLARDVFKGETCQVFKTKIGIVTSNWLDERPMIFKNTIDQAHGSKGSFEPFFGICIADAVIASCSAYPFFNTHTVKKSNGDSITLADGGFCANNPTLYAVADACLALKQSYGNLRVISLGVGVYPQPALWEKASRVLRNWSLMRHVPGSEFLQKVLGTNTSSMDVLRNILFKGVPTIRISETFAEPEMATDLLEHDIKKLNRLVQKGRLSFARNEPQLKQFLET